MKIVIVLSIVILNVCFISASCEKTGEISSIVIAKSSSEQIVNAASIFQRYLLRSMDVEVPIVYEQEKSGLAIHIGLTAYVESKNLDLHGLDEDGYLFLNEGDGNFIILGGTDWGTEFGVYAFLEEYLGVRWLMPTELGTDIPTKDRLVVEVVNKRVNPAYLSRHLSPIDINETDDLGQWGRFNKVRKRIESNHNLNQLFAVERYGKSNPDFYPYIHGKINVPTGASDYRWQPNFFAKGIADSAAVFILEYFEKHPEVKSFSLSINDDASRFDRSSLSSKGRNRRTNYLGLVSLSDEYFRWANSVVSQVSEIFPNRTYGTLAYNNLMTPPIRKIGVHRNIVPFITNERLRWANPDFKEKDIRLTEDWKKVSANVGWYDYSYGRAYLVPRIWSGTMSEYLRWGMDNGIRHYTSEVYPNWGEGPKPYLLTKLLWDPTLNVDTLTYEWCERFAGEKSARKLVEYFRLWDNFWTHDIQNTTWYNLNSIYLDFENPSYLANVSNSLLMRSERLLREAYALASDETKKRRVQALLDMWQLYRIAIEFYQSNSVEITKLEDFKRSKSFLAHLDKLRVNPLYEMPIAYIRKYLKYK